MVHLRSPSLPSPLRQHTPFFYGSTGEKMEGLVDSFNEKIVFLFCYDNTVPGVYDFMVTRRVVL